MVVTQKIEGVTEVIAGKNVVLTGMNAVARKIIQDKKRAKDDLQP